MIFQKEYPTIDLIIVFSSVISVFSFLPKCFVALLKNGVCCIFAGGGFVAFLMPCLIS